MSDDINNLRYYSKDKYEAAMGAFVIGLIMMFFALLSIVFITLEQFGLQQSITNIDFISLRYWGYWLFIPAFFLILGGFQQLYTNRRYRNAVKNAIMMRGNQGTFKLEHIALETGIRPNVVLRILADLRNQGMIRYRFNPESGEIVIGETIAYTPSESYVSPPTKLKEPLPTKNKDFCVYCGHNIVPGAIFCENCGSKI
ncbi:MAG: zinc-ribbon domain-containing protein [Candidatus Hodarchaeales archaeon]|jgi:hypothetical protein